MSGGTPTGEPAAGERGQMRNLQRALLDASDAQITRVLGMVDAMPARGDADALIAPLRPRLALLHPVRPATLTRLLFTPLNPLIVAGPSWRRGVLAVPRTALPSLAGVVQAALGAAWTAAEAELAAADREAWHRIGRTLWPRAAAILRAGTMPADWPGSSGLQEADHRAIATIVAGSLAHAADIDDLLVGALGGMEPTEHDFAALFEEVAPAGGETFSAVIALLGARLPRATAMLKAADSVAIQQPDQTVRQAANRSIDAMLASMEQHETRPTTSLAAANDLRRMVALLTDIETMGGQMPARRIRIDKLRRELDSTSRQTFTEAMDAELLRPAAAIATADDAMIAVLEAAARDLRRFEQIARRLGGAEHYDRRLRDAAGALVPQPDDSQVTVVDRIRLIEILQGPEAAQAAMPG